MKQKFRETRHGKKFCDCSLIRIRTPIRGKFSLKNFGNKRLIKKLLYQTHSSTSNFLFFFFFLREGREWEGKRGERRKKGGRAVLLVGVPRIWSFAYNILTNKSFKILKIEISITISFLYETVTEMFELNWRCVHMATWLYCTYRDRVAIVIKNLFKQAHLIHWLHDRI